MTIQILPASYYKRAYENNLQMVGVEDRLPQWMGTSVDWKNFDENNGD